MGQLDTLTTTCMGITNNRVSQQAFTIIITLALILIMEELMQDMGMEIPMGSTRPGEYQYCTELIFMVLEDSTSEFKSILL